MVGARVGRADGLIVGEAVGVRRQQFCVVLPQLLSLNGIRVATGGQAAVEHKPGLVGYKG